MWCNTLCKIKGKRKIGECLHFVWLSKFGCKVFLEILLSILVDDCCIRCLVLRKNYSSDILFLIFKGEAGNQLFYVFLGRRSNLIVIRRLSCCLKSFKKI